MNKTSSGTGMAAEPSAEQTVDAMRDEIDRTRSDLGQTITAIEHKLSPATLREKATEEIQVVEERVKAAVEEQIDKTTQKLKVELAHAKETAKRELTDALDHAKKAVRAATIGKVETMARRANQTTVDARDSILDTLWQNPLPTVLAGVGLTWLLMNRRTAGAADVPQEYGDSGWRRPGMGAHGGGAVQQGLSRTVHEVSQRASELASSAGHAVSNASDAAGRLTHDVADKAGHVVHGAADAAGRLAHQVSDGASHLAHEAGEMGTQAAHMARDRARRADQSLHQALQTNPLAVGAAVLVAGAVVGIALPRTRREDALMGEMRDDLLDKARDAAGEAMGSAKALAHHGIEEAKSSIESAASPR